MLAAVLVTLWSYAAYVSSQDAVDLLRVRALADTLGQPIDRLILGLQTERRITAETIAGAGPTTPALVGAREGTDRAAAEIREFTEGPRPSAAQRRRGPRPGRRAGPTARRPGHDPVPGGHRAARPGRGSRRVRRGRRRRLPGVRPGVGRVRERVGRRHPRGDRAGPRPGVARPGGHTGQRGPDRRAARRRRAAPADRAGQHPAVRAHRGRGRASVRRPGASTSASRPAPSSRLCSPWRTGCCSRPAPPTPWPVSPSRAGGPRRTPPSARCRHW